MPGTLTLRPLSANISRDTQIIGKMDPYCKIVLGKQKVQSQVCKNGGKHPHWDDTMTLRVIDEPTLSLEIKEKDWLLPDGTIGTCNINLSEIEKEARVLKWYPIQYEKFQVGKILIEASYQSDHSIPRNPEKPVENKQQQPNAQPMYLPSGPFKADLVQRTDYDGGQVPGGYLTGGQALVFNPITGHTMPLKAVHHPELEAKYQQEHQQQHQLYQQQHNVHQKELEQQGMKQEPMWAPPLQQADSQAYPQKYPQFNPSNYGHTYGPGMDNQGHVIDYRNVNQPTYLAGTEQQQGGNQAGYNPYDPLNIIRGK